MKRILCYGDSNTFGTVPMASQDDSRRHPFEIRWPGVVAQHFGARATIIEEGLPGRTTVHDDPIEGAYRNGRPYLQGAIESHNPLDVVIIMLGVNDLKMRFSVTPWDIAEGVGKLADLVMSNSALAKSPPKILLVAAPPIIETGWLGDMFSGGAEKSRHIAKHLKNVAETRKVECLDLAPVATVSPIDGIHFDETNQIAIGNAIASKLQSMIG
jgi:lysophospholipase L1-like esterase